MKLLDKQIFQRYLDRLTYDQLVDVCHELQCEVAVDDSDEHLVMKYNCAVAAKWHKMSKYQARTIQKGNDGEMFTLVEFVEFCKQGKFNNGIGFYANNPFTYTDIPLKPVHVLSNCHRTDFNFIIWFEFHCYDDYVDDIEEERLDYTMNFDDVSTHKTDNDEASIFRNKRLELLSIFVNKSKNNEPADLTDIEDFDYFVQRYWDLEWKHDAIAYEKNNTKLQN